MDTGRSERAEAGSVLIEAAVVLPVFLLLVFSAIEYGMVMYVTALIDDAVTQGSRYGMTGSNYTQLQPELAKCMNKKTDRSTFLQCFVSTRADLMCPAGNCVTVMATPYSGWTSTAPAGGAGFNTGSGGQVVQYTVVYAWHTLSPLMRPFLGKTYYIISSAVVQDEAF